MIRYQIEQYAREDALKDPKLRYGWSIFGPASGWYVGTASELKKVGVMESGMVNPHEEMALGRSFAKLRGMAHQAEKTAAKRRSQVTRELKKLATMSQKLTHGIKEADDMISSDEEDLSILLGNAHEHVMRAHDLLMKAVHSR